MTPEQAAALAALNPPRLPESFAAFGWPDAVAALSAGLLLAALILLLAGPFLSRRPRKPGLRAELRAARALTPPARRLRLLHLLAERNQALPADLSAALYAPTPPVDLDARLEALLRAGGAG